MASTIAKGIELLDEIPGDGKIAEKGCVVTYNARIYLRRGDEVTTDFDSIAAHGERLETRLVDGVQLIDHKSILGKRQPIAGVEKSLIGTQPGGYREVLISPHPGYAEAGLGARIPANAVLRIRLWVPGVRDPEQHIT